MVADHSASTRSAQALLDAVVALSSADDVHEVLARIVASSCELTDATYGALGVIGADGNISELITHTTDGAIREGLTDLPTGLGSSTVSGRPDQSFLGQPVSIRGTVFGNLYLTGKRGGGPFTEQDEILVGALSSAAGFVVENARAYALSERQRSWLEASARLDETLQAPIELLDALPHIAAGTRTVSGALAVGVFRLDANDEPALVAADGREAHRLAEAHALVRTELASAFHGDQPDDVPLGPDRRVLLLPLRTHLISALVLLVIVDARQDATRQPTQEKALTMSFADQAARALDRLQALSDRQQLALITDRDRIARELHDLVIQRLFATGLHLQGLRARAQGPGVVDRIDQAIADLGTTISDIRSTIFELEHADNDELSLRSAVRELTESYADILGFKPSVRTVGPVDTMVGETIAEHVLAVLREALSNAARHAGATTTLVEIEVTINDIGLRVSDDGCGVPELRTESGLRNVRRRAEQLGGDVQLTQASPHGTVLEWRVPLISAKSGIGLHEG
jgi:signal transduction histidine kinase